MTIKEAKDLIMGDEVKVKEEFLHVQHNSQSNSLRQYLTVKSKQLDQLAFFVPTSSCYSSTFKTIVVAYSTKERERGFYPNMVLDANLQVIPAEPTAEPPAETQEELQIRVLLHGNSVEIPIQFVIGVEKEAHKCVMCKKKTKRTQKVHNRDNHICIDCLKKDVNKDMPKYIRCRDCMQIFEVAPEETEVSGSTRLCIKCYEDDYTRCSHCNRIIHNDDVYRPEHGDENYCCACYDEFFRECHECGATIHVDDTHMIGRHDYCTHCWENMDNDEIRDLEDELTLEDISRIYKRKLTIKKSLMTDEFPGGVEIECNIRDKRKLNQSLRKEVGITGDGSLQYPQGVEIITPPASGDHFKKLIKDTCKNLKKLKAYIDKKCGLHLHIQHKNNPSIIYKTLILYYAIEGLLFKMVSKSRRMDNDYCKSLTDTFKNLNEILKINKNKLDFAIYNPRKPTNKMYIDESIRQTEQNIQNIKKNTELLLKITDPTTLSNKDREEIDNRIGFWIETPDKLKKAIKQIHYHLECQQKELKRLKKSRIVADFLDTNIYKRKFVNKRLLGTFYTKGNKLEIKKSLSNAQLNIEHSKREKYASPRYHFLNLHSIYYRGTVELRLHQGTINSTKIINWYKLHKAIIQYTHGKQFDIDKIMEIYGSMKTLDKLEKLAKLINLPKPVYKYYIKRIKELNNKLCAE